MEKQNESFSLDFSKGLRNLGTSVVVSSSAMFIAKAVRILSLSLVNIILINFLKPEDFGSVRYVLIIVGIATLINETGITTAIVQKEEFSENLLFPLFIINFLWGFFIYIIILILSPFLSNFFNAMELQNVFRIGSLMIPLLSISSVHRAWLRRRMEFVKLAIIETVATLLSSIFTVTFALLGGGIWALLGGYLLFDAINTLILLSTQKFPILTFINFKNIFPILLWGAGVVVFHIIDYMLSNAPYFMIGKLAGKEALGFFSVSQELAFLPRLAINAVSGVIILSTFSRIQNDTQKTIIVFKKLVLFISIISIPLQLIITIMPYEVLQIICFVKKKSVWLEAAPFLRWISATAIIYNYTYFLNTIWISNGKVKSSAIVSFLMLCTIVITIIIGYQWGLIGVCKAIFLRAIIIFPIYIYLNYLFLNISVKIYIKSLLPSIVGGVIMGIYLLVIQQLFKTHSLMESFIKFIVSFTTGFFLYILSLKIFSPIALQEIIDTFKTPLKSLLKKESL